jgi:hypothetical protein
LTLVLVQCFCSAISREGVVDQAEGQLKEVKPTIGPARETARHPSMKPEYRGGTASRPRPGLRSAAATFELEDKAEGGPSIDWIGIDADFPQTGAAFSRCGASATRQGFGGMCDRHVCPECALGIGAYERFVWQMSDGSRIGSEAAPRGTDVERALDVRGRRLHLACVPIDADQGEIGD